MASILHKLAHLFGLYHGTCYSFYDKEKLMMSFKCSKCGNLEGVHEVYSHIFDDMEVRKNGG